MTYIKIETLQDKNNNNDKFYKMHYEIFNDYRLNLEEVSLYMLLYSRCSLSAFKFIESGYDYDFQFWDNRKDTVFCVYPMEELEIKLRKKRNYISKCIKKLKELNYIDTEIDRKTSNSNKFYLKERKKADSIATTTDL